MKFHVYALNYNESHLLPVFFEHYKQADKIYILDNESTDESRDIIQRYGRDCITFKSQGGFNDFDNSRARGTYWKQSKGIADYVIIQDLDEFVFFPKFPNNLTAAFEDLKSRKITAALCHGLQMFCTDEEFATVRASCQSIASQVCTGSREFMHEYYDKVLIFDPNFYESIIFHPGGHSVTVKEKTVPDTSSALLLHYKFIGLEYSYQRALELKKRSSHTNKSNNFGRQYWAYTNEQIRERYEAWFAKYGTKSLFSVLYPNKDMKQYTYKHRSCVLHTYGGGDALSREVLHGGIWEPRVAAYIWDFFQTRQDANAAYIDIGCNIGTHLAVAVMAGAKRAHAVECNPNTVRLLRSTIQVNGWDETVQLYPVAVSDTSGNLPFVQVTDNLGASYIPTTHKGWGGPRAPLKEGVEAVTFPMLGIDCSGLTDILVKLDIEGHELNALKTMTEFLTQPAVTALILELNHACSTRETIEQVLEFLSGYGFTQIRCLFTVPQHPWAGGVLATCPVYPTLSKGEILRAVDSKNILEVVVTRG